MRAKPANVSVVGVTRSNAMSALGGLQPPSGRQHIPASPLPCFSVVAGILMPRSWWLALTDSAGPQRTRSRESSWAEKQGKQNLQCFCRGRRWGHLAWRTLVGWFPMGRLAGDCGADAENPPWIRRELGGLHATPNRTSADKCRRRGFREQAVYSYAMYSRDHSPRRQVDGPYVVPLDADDRRDGVIPSIAKDAKNPHHHRHGKDLDNYMKERRAQENMLIANMRDLARNIPWWREEKHRRRSHIQ